MDNEKLEERIRLARAAFITGAVKAGFAMSKKTAAPYSRDYSLQFYEFGAWRIVGVSPLAQVAGGKGARAFQEDGFQIHE
ncbi:hypothetical protein HY995_01055 [Candidatus Micrarchaeota archaeon]|nr:hypothetical protein [Candidatus Micrarchaeota archaeon]